MRVIPQFTEGTKEVFNKLGSEQMRYYADILEEATKCTEEDEMTNAKKPDIEELKHNSKGEYKDYKPK